MKEENVLGEDASFDLNQRFAFSWKMLTDTLREMGVPALIAIQLEPNDSPDHRFLFHHLCDGVAGRIIMATLIARDGLEALNKIVPGLNLEKASVSKEQAERDIAQFEQSDMKMNHVEIPMDFDTFEELRKEAKGEQAPGQESA